MIEKAYKLLALQENISHNVAKELIDKGLVSARGKRVLLARSEMPKDTIFKVQNLQSATILYKDNDIMAIDKPPFVTSEEIIKQFPSSILLNRLDKETSGVMLFAQNDIFQKKAIQAFKDHQVYKEYIAIVHGKFTDEIIVDKPIATTKGFSAKSRIDLKNGKQATTKIFPWLIEGKKSKVRILIDTGRTHQIRVHLASIGFPIIGDLLYGKASAKVNRIMLHSLETRIFDYDFKSKEPREFRVFGL